MSHLGIFEKHIKNHRVYRFYLLKFSKLKLLRQIFRLSSGIKNLGIYIRVLKDSKSQLFQELFVLAALDFKDGYFVEVGGTDGIFLSNTFILEQRGWNGVIFEPSKFWHKDLRDNRTCIVDFRAVFNVDNVNISFSETSSPELSSITSLRPRDDWWEERLNSLDYVVRTVTLNTALKQFNLSFDLDYLSIDTEGSELEVLEGLDFHSFGFKVITVEVADDFVKGLKIGKLLEENGFLQVFKGETLWDSWYLHNTLYADLVFKGRLKLP